MSSHSIFGDLSMDYKPTPGLSNDARLAVIEEIVGRMEQRLFGNGQEGEISKIKGRLTELEKWKWKLVGAGALLVILAQLVAKLWH